ncbi:MAG: ABC transporter permease [Actinobacteria bacterium]|nr:ABC transporter permease [Actinomycetota bacterium]
MSAPAVGTPGGDGLDGSSGDGLDGSSGDGLDGSSAGPVGARADAPPTPARRFLGGRLSLRVLVTPLALALAGVAVWSVSQSETTDFDRAQVGALLNRAFIQARLAEHVRLSTASSGLALLVALPAGVALTRGRAARFAQPLVWVARAGQTIPTISVLALVVTYTSLGFRPALVALWIYSILPILQNTVVGLRGVDADVIDAARGMGMAPATILRRVELPLALPVIVAGVRTAVVLNVGTAALATFVGAGGLGQIVDTGITNLSQPLLYAGAGFTAILALAFDWVVALIGDLITPPRLA